VRALLSVADRAGIADLAREMLDQGIEVYATDGTRDALKEAGVEVSAVAELTHGPPLVGGQVKTFHQEIYAGILARRHMPEDMASLEQNGLGAFDIVVVSIRPFAPQVGRRIVAIDEAVEMIDVGGPSLLGAAARNFGGVAAVCDPADYGLLIDEVRQHGAVSADVRQRLTTSVVSASPSS
jgi:phosphoribosylaminoimidazolecarboxamide formyltransferase/IMP cyclohydrolase